MTDSDTLLQKALSNLACELSSTKAICAMQAMVIEQHTQKLEQGEQTLKQSNDAVQQAGIQLMQLVNQNKKLCDALDEARLYAKNNGICTFHAVDWKAKTCLNCGVHILVNWENK